MADPVGDFDELRETSLEGAFEVDVVRRDQRTVFSIDRIDFVPECRLVVCADVGQRREHAGVGHLGFDRVVGNEFHLST